METITTSLSQQLARFAVETSTATIPDSARQIARLSLLDWLAVALAGVDEPVSRIVRQMVSAEVGSSQAGVFGSNQRFPLRAAALLNGATSHALDYDDTHFIYIGHPSVAVFPAALAMAEHCEASLEAFLDAALLGMETACRVGDWLGRSHYQQGFHQTATAGSFGATVAAARLAGLDAEQTRYALGIAASRASGLKSQFGTMGKPYHAGMAAANGVEAVQLAALGFVSNPDALEVEQGFADTHHAEKNIAALEGLGEQFVFESVQHKFHACCHGTHAMLEALIRFWPANAIPIPQIKDIIIAIHPRFLKVCNIQSPTTGLEMKFSLRMAAALALLNYDTAALSTFNDALCHDEALVALRDKTSVIGDEKLTEMQARVTISGLAGERISMEYDLDAPMTYAERETKVRRKAGSLIGAERVDGMWAVLAGHRGNKLSLHNLITPV